MTQPKKHAPRYEAKQIKKLPGFLRRLYARASADVDLLARKLQDASLAWPGRKQKLRRPRAQAMAAAVLALLQTANLATGYAHLTVTEAASRCGLRTRSKAGNYSNSRFSRSLKQLCKLAGFVEYKAPPFNPERHACDPALIVVLDELYLFLGAKPDELKREQEKAVRRLLAERKRKAEEGRGVPVREIELPADPVEAAFKLQVEQWAKYTKTTAERAAKKINRMRKEHAEQLHRRSNPLSSMLRALAAAMRPRRSQKAQAAAYTERLQAARQGLLFDPPI